MRGALATLLLVAALAGCRDEAAARPEPVAMTAESVGHFCQMNLLEHPGPKAQVHLRGMPHPLFFSQARDAVAFRLLPEQDGEIAAIYVSDMAVAPWDDPGPSNWIAAEDAFYVTGSRQAGGMGTPELIPFGTRDAAQAFVAANGGEVRRLDDIPAELVLAADSRPGPAAADDDADFAARLKALSATRPEEKTP
ncbi:nitrous oxide reductase accessory protein NosL [Paracoccus luteus]|uniref:nitrous oxide reductase accessory protein NosL n=1 Tax=Paracoccus luteus TaxID=2508543 RepID=UPI00107005F7|nr:nitrous oxide reductase accessory protein NosL [Paracoccus luteus]